MIQTTAGREKKFIAIISLVACCALGLQLYILVANALATGVSMTVTISRFFSYFTILTNLLVAFSLSALLSGSGSLYRFFSGAPVKAAIAVYIAIVGLGYNLLLRHLWKPAGLQFIADELLHDVVPILYVLYWWFFVRRSAIKWKYLFIWLLYPLLYLCYALLRGSIDGFYPYPFLSVKEIGYTSVFVNSFFLLIAFIVVGSIVIAFSKSDPIIIGSDSYRIKSKK